MEQNKWSDLEQKHMPGIADLVENSVVGIHRLALDGTILWANQAQLDLLGYTGEEYMGHPISEFHDDPALMETRLSQLISGINQLNFEARLKHKTGSTIDVLINSNVRLANGQIRSIDCFTVNISTRKRTEDRIRLLYELTAALADALTPEEAVRVILERGIGQLGANGGSVVRLDERQQELEIVGSFGYSTPLLQQWQRFSVETPSPLSDCVRTGQAVMLRNLPELEDQYPSMKGLDHQGRVSWAALPLKIEKRILGGLGFSFTTPQAFEMDQCRFMVTLAHQCAQAMERTRLARVAREQAVLDERQRLARELHDSVSQTLFSLTAVVHSLSRLIDRQPVDLASQRQHLEHLTGLSQAGMAEMRVLLLELRPASLLKTGLPELFRQLIQAIESRTRLVMTQHVSLPGPPPEEVHIALFRIAQEAIQNIAKHSEATSASITLAPEACELVLRIQDNGTGFDLHHQPNPAGLGLGNMRERAENIGAILQIITEPDQGTEIIVRWPIQAQPA